ncbi:hypothetical protein C3387_07320 [Leclercia sp. LSNIH6]|nr:hypothetical protein C3370_09135 [Leclercia sp. LSNIH7]POU79275.1 hypothetical protein C3387_07320 [Leclercia sp. LSNIH6]POW54247.1 hypothetical protein C3406_03180 [Leclercia sp. LSNIH8]
MEAPRGHSLHGCRLVPDPKACRNKLRAPRSGDFLCREPGLPGGRRRAPLARSPVPTYQRSKERKVNGTTT